MSRKRRGHVADFTNPQPALLRRFPVELLHGTERRVTEGREANGPLFTQEADARARAEARAQGSLFESCAQVAEHPPALCPGCRQATGPFSPTGLCPDCYEASVEVCNG